MLKYVAIKFEKSSGQLQSLRTSSTKSAGEKSHSYLPLKVGIRQAASLERPDPFTIPHEMALGGPKASWKPAALEHHAASRTEQPPAKSPASTVLQVAPVPTSTVVLMNENQQSHWKTLCPKPEEKWSEFADFEGVRNSFSYNLIPE